MGAALRQGVILGPTTNIAFLLDLLDHPAFIAGEIHTGFIIEHFPQWQPQTATHVQEAALAAVLSQSQYSHVTAKTEKAAAFTPWQQLGGWRLGT
jgi:3-methylcrotonyl-CoA carboxylase alpha subunit